MEQRLERLLMADCAQWGTRRIAAIEEILVFGDRRLPGGDAYRRFRLFAAIRIHARQKKRALQLRLTSQWRRA